MKQDLLSFVGSDCHGTKERISRIGEAYDYVSKKKEILMQTSFS